MSWKDARRDADKLLEKLQISDKGGKMATTLSGGMKRKLCLAVALIGNPKV